MANPALFPLFYHTEARDIIILHINSMCRPALPKTAVEIGNRLNEITFNSSLLKEFRSIAFVTKLLESARDARRMRSAMKAGSTTCRSASGASAR
jgi:NTE family protein